MCEVARPSGGGADHGENARRVQPMLALIAPDDSDRLELTLSEVAIAVGLAVQDVDGSRQNDVEACSI
jgi:hypothetical protein